MSGFSVTGRTRDDVWSEMCEAETWVRYFQHEHKRHVKYYKFAAAPAAVPFFISLLQSPWSNLPRSVQIIIGIICVIPLVLSFDKDPYKGGVAHFVQEECGKVRLDLRGLLADIDSNRINEMQSRTKLTNLSQSLNVACNKASIAKLTIKESLKNKIKREVVISNGGEYYER